MALIKCINCEKEYSSELNACPHCGFEPLVFKCPECGRICAKADKTCGYCGCSLESKALEIASMQDHMDYYNAALDVLENSEDINNLQKAENAFLAIRGFQDADEKARECKDKYAALMHKEWIKGRYAEACGMLEQDKSFKTCQNAIGILKAFPDFEDAQEKINECQAIIDDHKRKAKKRSLKLAGIVAGVIALIFLAVLVFSPCTILGHNYDKGKITKKATCAVAGERTFTCERCGDTYTNPIAATGDHKWSKWTTTVKATYTHGGTKERYCKVCGEKETEDIEQKERPASYYKDKEIFNTGRKSLDKVYCMNGSITFSGWYNGDSNFIVELLDSNQDLEEVVCNEIGTYQLEKTVYCGVGWHYIQIYWGTDGDGSLTWYGTGGER